eukprot:3007540-Prymnesium_polylepis.1
MGALIGSVYRASTGLASWRAGTLARSTADVKIVHNVACTPARHICAAAAAVCNKLAIRRTYGSLRASVTPCCTRRAPSQRPASESGRRADAATRRREQIERTTSLVSWARIWPSVCSSSWHCGGGTDP